MRHGQSEIVLHNTGESRLTSEDGITDRTDLADVLKELLTGRADEVIPSSLFSRERENRRKTIMLDEVADDKVVVHAYTRPEIP